MERLIWQLLSQQDPGKRHTWLTRVLVTLIILFAFLVLYGVYGVLASVVFYLLGVELAGLDLVWMYLPFLVMLGVGLWKSRAPLSDYWRNYGHGGSL